MKFGYARKYTEDEENLNIQIDKLQEYGVDEIYREIPSDKKSTEQLNILLNKLRAGDILVVHKLNRLGRTAKQFLTLAEEFNNKGINIVSLEEKFDTTSINGRFALEMFCTLAQMDRDILSEKTKSGIKAARLRGKGGGRKPTDPEIVQRVIKMYLSNEYSIAEIIESTGISKTSIYNYIKEYKDRLSNFES